MHAIYHGRASLIKIEVVFDMGIATSVNLKERGEPESPPLFTALTLSELL